MSAVIDGNDEDCRPILVDAEQDSVVTAASASVRRQFAAGRLAESVRIIGQWPGDEFDDGDRNFVGKALKVLPGGPSHLDVVAALLSAHRGGSPNSARSASPSIVDLFVYSCSPWSMPSRMPACESQ